MNEPATPFNIPSVNQWKKFFTNKGLKDVLINKYIEYVQVLNSNKLPIIFEFKHLSALLGRKTNYLASVINSTNSHYRSFEIPKRSGGKRVIVSPYPALLECQYWILENILENLSVYHTAHGYVKGKSIVTNAYRHLNQEMFLKIDIKDFYPSINISRVIKLFQYYGYNQRVSFYLASLCTLNNELPQGAPTSPTISNLVVFKLDKRLDYFAKKFDLIYTRYADDIVFTGKKITVKHYDYVKDIIKDEGFILNDDKTILQQKKRKRIVTGISISSGSLKIPRNYKRKLRQELYYINEYGFYSHISKLKIRDPNYLDSLIGKVNFWIHVEGDDEEAIEYLEMLKGIRTSFNL